MPEKKKFIKRKAAVCFLCEYIFIYDFYKILKVNNPDFKVQKEKVKRVRYKTTTIIKLLLANVV